MRRPELKGSKISLNLSGCCCCYHSPHSVYICSYFKSYFTVPFLQFRNFSGSPLFSTVSQSSPSPSSSSSSIESSSNLYTEVYRAKMNFWHSLCACSRTPCVYRLGERPKQRLSKRIRLNRSTLGCDYSYILSYFPFHLSIQEINYESSIRSILRNTWLPLERFTEI